MKKILLLMLVGVLVGGFVSAVVHEIETRETKTLTSNNGICEYYQKEFSLGEEDSISVNGETLNIEYFGNKIWELNDYNGELKNHDFFVNNEKENLKSVRLDFSFMSNQQSEGNFGLTEQDYYPWDCQGYSKSTGMISEVKIGKGWNLIPWTTSLRDCYYALEGELCKDDVLVSYYYVPLLNKYFTETELEKEYESNSELQDYFDEENEFILMKSSKWIYVKPSGRGKQVIGNFGAYIPYRNKYLDNNVYRLSEGWNFLFVDAFMIYSDDWKENPLSLDDMKGSCDIEKVYLWDYFDQEWMKIDGELDDDMVGMGIVVKVSDDCALGWSGSGSSGNGPPGFPDEGNDDPEDENNDGEISINYPQEISGYSLKSKNLDDDSYCDYLDGAEICAKSGRLQYSDDDSKKSIHVLPILVTKGKEDYLDYVKKNSQMVSSGVYRRSEMWELFWDSENYLFITQDYTYAELEDGSTKASTNTADVNNPVVQYFLGEYPPIA